MKHPLLHALLAWASAIALHVAHFRGEGEQSFALAFASVMSLLVAVFMLWRLISDICSPKGVEPWVRHFKVVEIPWEDTTRYFLLCRRFGIWYVIPRHERLEPLMFRFVKPDGIGPTSFSTPDGARTHLDEIINLRVRTTEPHRNAVLVERYKDVG